MRNQHEKSHQENPEKRTPRKRKLEGPSTSGHGEVSEKRAKVKALKDISSDQNIQANEENRHDFIHSEQEVAQ